MSELSELRVHGVSGTPPRDILYSDPAPGGGGDQYTRTWRRRPTHPLDEPWTTEAFSWSGLTSGSWVTAFWILLSPFAFANAAGWMAARDTRLGRFGVRAAGLALTGLFTAEATTALVVIPQIWMNRIGVEEWKVELIVGVLAFVVGIGFGFIVWRFSTRSHFRDFNWSDRAALLFSLDPAPMLVKDDDVPDDLTDPAGSTVGDRVTWERPAILHRLRRLHLGCGLAVIGLCVAAQTGFPVSVGVPVVALASILVALLLMTADPKRGVILTAISPHLGGVGLAVPAAWIWFGTVEWVEAPVHQVVLGVALGVLVFGVVAARCGLLTLGGLTIATLFGGVLGIAAGLLVERGLTLVEAPEVALNQLQPNGAAWVSVAMLIMVEILAVVALWLAGRRDGVTADSGAKRMLRAVVRRGDVLMRVAALYGLAAGLIALGRVLWLAVDKGLAAAFQPDALGDPNTSIVAHVVVFGLAGLIALLLLVRLMTFLEGTHKRVLLLAIGGLAVVGLAVWGLRSWLGIDPGEGTDLATVAVTLMILLPGGAMFNSILQGIRQGETNRRKVGILWDLGSFWPRWFHPLAPPAYGPHVVDKLKVNLADHPPTVIGAHSQGSLIAAVTLAQMTGSRPRGLISYGSQLGELYPKMFPKSGIAELTRKIATGGDSPEWINLWRDDDPIGGHVLEVLGPSDGGPGPPSNQRLREGSGHSAHEDTLQYRLVRDLLSR